MDIYHALFIDKEFHIIGDRVGDKLHESLISEDEMKHTLDVGDKYVILPQLPRWEYLKPRGESCADRPCYDSYHNKRYLDVEEIKERMAKIG
jgi:UDP-N-acetylglucosamine 4,6-dehydratase